MNSRRAGSLATAAAEAQIQMARRVVVELDASVSERLHQIDSAARRVHLGSRHDVGRARLRAKPAMNAVEEQVIVGDISKRTPRWRHARLVHQIPPTKHPGLKIPAGSKA